MVSVYDVGVHCGGCSDVVTLERPENSTKYGVILAAILGLIGLGVGLTIGVATAGFGMAAFPFTTVIAGYVGYRFGKWTAKKRYGVTCPGCGHDFS